MTNDHLDFSIDEVAQRLRVDPSTLYKRRQGDRLVFDDGTSLKLRKFARYWRVTRVELERFLDTGLA